MKSVVKNNRRAEKVIVKFNELPALRRKYRDKKIVFCLGSFDITHAGHALFFEECKKWGDILVVGIGADKTIQQYKPGRPITNEHVRLKMVSALKPVNHCFIQPYMPFNDVDELNDFLHVIFVKLEPDIYVINDDAPGIPHRKEIINQHPDGRMLILKRRAPRNFDAISTTAIIKKARNVRL